MDFIAIVGFIFMLVLMCILVSGKAAPPVVFTVLPVVVSLILGFSFKELTEFIETGMASMLDTAVLFVFAISYFTLMSEMGLFDPMVDFLMKRTGKSITTILLAVMVTTFVAHLDGSGATTFLIVVPAFLPLCKKAGIRPQALLASMCGMYGVMNLVPWGGPTLRAATVIQVPANELYASLLPGLICLVIVSTGIVVVVARIEQKHGADISKLALMETDSGKSQEQAGHKKNQLFNLLLTIGLLAILFADTPLPLYVVFMIAYVAALVVNFPNVKDQNKKIKEYGSQAVSLTVTLFSVGIFMGVLKESGMINAMANAIIAMLPEAITPHLHWFVALLAVPVLMILGTNAFYYALLPIVIGVVEPYGISPETVAVTFLLTATLGTPLSPSVATNYVGLGLTDLSIGEHIRYSLRILWPASIATLVLCTLVGVIPF
ncbi:MAG: citrate transporter [Lachnospiraceae bacterium]|nr:citrate transporter [Lachnospiraceae bacterium]